MNNISIINLNIRRTMKKKNSIQDQKTHLEQKEIAKIVAKAYKSALQYAKKNEKAYSDLKEISSTLAA